MILIDFLHKNNQIFKLIVRKPWDNKKINLKIRDFIFYSKKVEIAVTKIIHRMVVANRGALRNPKSLDFYKKIREELK